jgi:phage/plasmid-like protein (TIGR03299 family)
MPAGIYGDDSLFSVRETPWHGLGVILPKPPRTIDEAVKLAGLDWTVRQEPVHLSNGEPVEGYFVNMREDTNKPLGIVSARYTPVQNREAFSFLASIFGSEMHFETAGSLMNGRRVWVLMKIPSWVEVGGDPIGQYSFVSNSHDGKSSVLVAQTPIRIVCSNTEYAALRLARGVHAQRTYTLRHLGNMSQKIAEARQVLDVTINYYEQFKHVGDQLALAKVDSKDAESFVKNLLPIDPDQKERAARNREEARQVILSIFNGDGPDGDTTGNAPGTYWCLYNAAVEYADWMRPERKQGGRFQRALDDPDGFKSKAFELALAGADLA